MLDQRMWKSGWLVSCVFSLLFFVGCVPKAPNQEVRAAVSVNPEVTAQPELETVNEEDLTAQANETEVLPEPEPDREEKRRPVPDIEQVIEPRHLLDTALDALQQATDDWKEGRLDESVANLDLAYEIMLEIKDEDDLDILQEKEDLRVLISRRIIEVYAARHMVVGEVSKSIPIVMNDHVNREIKSFQNRERQFFLDSYQRSGRYRPMILEKLREQGLPEQLSWLPLIESGFKTNAYSRARALGPWQFITSTGYRYGMNRNQYIDERMDPVKSTDAAIKYLSDLHGLFGDWMTALAGYNCGEGRVSRAIKSQRINYLDDFWDLYNVLPRETARYVPRFLATLIILENPEKYGIELPELYPPVVYALTTINKSVKLTELDKLAGVPAGQFKLLNPELRYGVTPEKEYQLHVPVDSLETVVAGMDKLQRWQLPADAFVVHRVRRGDTLSGIAKKYGTSVSRIVRFNRLRSQHRIGLGQRLKIPRKNTKIVAVSKKTTRPSGKSWATHSVVRGDSLWKIAKRYKTNINQIRKLNNLKNDRLHLGQKLKVRASRRASTADRTYTVKRGDTMAKIAKRHRVALKALLRANKMGKRDKIYPKQKLILPN